MDQEHQAQLEGTQKKLIEFRSRLEFLVQSVWGSKNVDRSDVLAAVNELQSLVEWVAQQPDLGPESAVLLVQLQELQKIRQNLKTTPADVEDSSPELIDGKNSKFTKEAKSNVKELLEFCDVINPNANGESAKTHTEEKNTVPYNYASVFESSPIAEEIENIAFDNGMPITGNCSLNSGKTINTDLEIKNDHGDTKSLSVTENKVDAQDLLSNDIERLLKSNAEIQDLLSSNSTMLTNSNIEIQDLLSSNSTMLTNSNIEIQDLLSTTSDISSIEFQDLLSSDTETIENNSDILLNELDILTKPNADICDFLSYETVIISKGDPEIKNEFSNELDILMQSNAELKEAFLKEIVPASKGDTKVADVLSNEHAILMQNNSELHNVSSINGADTSKSDTKLTNILFNGIDLLAQSQTEIKDATVAVSKSASEVNDVPSNDLAIWIQPRTEIHDMLLNDSESVSKSDKELKDMCTSNTDKLTEANIEARDTQSGDDEKTGAILDFLSSEDAVSAEKCLDVACFISPDSISNIKSMRNEVIILETNEDDKTIEWVNDPKSSNDPLDICMSAIRNLYDSLRVKENELLKLSVIQNDQKHIDALQGVIIDFHKDITNLNTQLDKTKKENNLLKEQVLELEEAENDARLEAQKLEQKLVFLQEKDSHSQAEICHLKQSLKKSAEKIAEKELKERESRSQIKYMETLVQKYEDQIKVMETKIKAHLEDKNESERAEKCKKDARCERGTQTYPWQAKLDSNIFLLNGTSSGNIDDSRSSTEANSSSNESQNIHCGTQVVNTFTCKNSSPDSAATNMENQFTIANEDGIAQKELNERLHKLMDEDVGLQQQIHNVDQINLALWKKLQNLETNIGDCKRKDINETDLTVNENDSNKFNVDSSDTNASELSTFNENNNIPEENINALNQNEQQHAKERLGETNVSFEKELKRRESICKEQEKKYEEWKKTEKRLISDLKQLGVQRDSLVNQFENLKREKEKLEQQVLHQQAELNELKDKNQMEVTKLRTEQEEMTTHLHHKVNQLITKEKELLKMIKNLKSERNQSQGKSELERLKSNYIQLQLELSNSREEIRKLEDSFKIRIDECVSKHRQEETRLITELERLRHENMRCDETIKELQLKQDNLINALDEKEKELQTARESFKKSLEDTEEVHRSVETELKSRLQKMEEGTVMVTTVLMEERMRVEKELQENIQDLRAKEEFYKAKISELERDVIHLHEELHKISEESEMNMDILVIPGNDSENQSNEINESLLVTSTSDNMQNDSHNSDQSQAVDTDLKKLPRAAESVESLSVVNQLQPSKETKLKETKSDVITIKTGPTDENVENLRAQVRELQAQLEKISDEVSEISPVPQAQGPAITAPCMGLQKEELDYAEVDECVAEWRKPALNLEAKKIVPQHYQPNYGNRYPSRYRNKYEKEKAAEERESSEENDYDEVLPRPTNFHIVQQVGQDALLVGWEYVNPSVLEGFEVYLDNKVHERIYIPDRTKALISGLNLRRPFKLSICALSRYGQVSEPAILDLSCQPENNSRYFEEEEDEYRDFEDSYGDKHRPYSMEW